MALYTLEEIKAEIIALKEKTAKAEESQAYTSGGPGGGMHTARGDLEAMYRRLQYLEKEYERLETPQAAQNSGGYVNKVQFVRPR